MRHDEWLETAIGYCFKSLFPTYKMCAILVKSGRLVAVGINKPSPGSTKSTHFKDWHSLHAELDLLQQIKRINPKHLRRAVMYVGGVKERSNNLLLSKPCESCQIEIKNHMREYGLKKVFYHDKDGSCKELVA